MPQILESFAPHVTTLAKLGIGTATADAVYPAAANPFTPVTSLIDFAEFSNGISTIFADGNRNRGAFDRRKNRTRLSALKIEPSIDCVPTVDEWNLYLAWIFGEAGTGSTTKVFKLKNNVGNLLHERNIQYDDGNGNCESFANCVIREAVITTGGNENLVSLRLSCIGRDYVTNVAFPALSNLDNTKSPFVLPDSNLLVLLNGNPTLAENITITLTTVINDRNYNVLTQTRNIKTDRIIRVSIDYPDGGFPTLYAGAEAGVPVQVKFVNGAYELDFDFVDVRFPREPRRYGTREEVKNTLNGTVYGTSTETAPQDDSLIATLKLS